MNDILLDDNISRESPHQRLQETRDVMSFLKRFLFPYLMEINHSATLIRPTSFS